MVTKICTKCGEELPTNMFGKDNAKKDKLQCSCKNCKKKYNVKNKENIAKRAKKYREDNKEFIAKIAKKYYKNNKMVIAGNKKEYRKYNKEHIAEYQKQYSKDNKESLKKYYEANKENIAKRAKKYRLENIEIMTKREKKNRQKNKESRKIYARKYQIEHREVVNRISQRRRAKERQVARTLTIQQWEDTKLHFNNKCAYCGEEKPLAQEHFIPLSKGGDYTAKNVIPSCKSCNSSKGNREFSIWFVKQKFYSNTREKKILKFLGYTNGIQQLKIC